jgi:hypothetical protein
MLIEIGCFLFFLLREKRSGNRAPKTMTAVFGWFFEELLCIEVKGSGAVVSAPERTSLYFTHTLFLSFMFFFASPKKNIKRRRENDDSRFRVVL